MSTVVGYHAVVTRYVLHVFMFMGMLFIFASFRRVCYFDSTRCNFPFRIEDLEVRDWEIVLLCPNIMMHWKNDRYVGSDSE